MANTKYNFSLQKEKLDEMKIMAIRHNMQLNEFLIWIFDNYQENIHSCDEDHGFDKYGKNQ